MNDDDLWWYQARVTRVIDGDTIDVDIDLGFNLTANTLRLRLLGVDTPEMRGPDRRLGEAARDYVQGWIDAAVRVDDQWPLRVRTIETDSFGRWLTEIRSADGLSLAADIIDNGHGDVYE
jgi:micrococcal nuclease